MWNFVPSIHSELGAGDRYMAFNAGRFAAFAESFGLSDTDAADDPDGVGGRNRRHDVVDSCTCLRRTWHGG